MFEIIRKLLTEPLYTSCAVIIVWLILYLLFVRIGKLSKVTWARLEYIWIGIGFLGVLTLIDENRKQDQINELENLNIWIEYDYKSLLTFTNYPAHCFKLIKSGLYTQGEFDRMQTQKDKICIWTKQVSYLIDSTFKNGKLKITTIPPLNITNPENEYVYKEIIKNVKELNTKINRRDFLIADTTNSFWKEIKYSFGVLLLIFAFGLRLTIVSKKVRDDKTKEQHSFMP